LEEAGLITTRKVGRERLHYLNPSPIRGVVEWAEQYRRHWDARMDRLEEYLQELQQQQAVTPEREATEPQVEEPETARPTQSKEVTDDNSE
jgi:hypothetical protein